MTIQATHRKRDCSTNLVLQLRLAWRNLRPTGAAQHLADPSLDPARAPPDETSAPPAPHIVSRTPLTAVYPRSIGVPRPPAPHPEVFPSNIRRVLGSFPSSGRPRLFRICLPRRTPYHPHRNPPVEDLKENPAPEAPRGFWEKKKPTLQLGVHSMRQALHTAAAKPRQGAAEADEQDS